MLPWPAVAASDHAAWSLIGRLGEAQLLLPAALAFAWWLARRSEARPLVQWWLSLMALAALVTTITKVAFIGWGVGNAAFDFTGVSGHAMFAAAVYPLLCAGVAASRARPWRRAALLAGYALALLIGVSRVVDGSHSTSEVLAGLALGLSGHSQPHTRDQMHRAYELQRLQTRSTLSRAAPAAAN